MTPEVKSSKGTEIDAQGYQKRVSGRNSKKRSLVLAWSFIVFAIGVPNVSAQKNEIVSQILNFRLQTIPKGNEVRYAGKI